MSVKPWYFSIGYAVYIYELIVHMCILYDGRSETKDGGDETSSSDEPPNSTENILLLSGTWTEFGFKVSELVFFCKNVRGYVRPSVDTSVRPWMRPFVRGYVRSSVNTSVLPWKRPIVRECVRSSVDTSVRPQGQQSF